MNCTFCNNTIKNRAGFSIHIKYCKSNPDNTETNKICKYCKKEFSCLSSMKRHLEERSCVQYTIYIEKELEHYKEELNNTKNNYEIQLVNAKNEYKEEITFLKNDYENKFNSISSKLTKEINAHKELQQKILILEKELDINSERIIDYKTQTNTILNQNQTILNINQEFSVEKSNNIKKIEEMANKIVIQECIQDELPKFLKHKNEINNFYLINYLNEIAENVKKDSTSILFGRICLIFFTNHLKNPEKLIVIDDNNNEHILKPKDIVYILKYICEECISFNKPMKEGEIKAFNKIFKLQIDKNQLNRYNLENLQKTIKILMEITEESEMVKYILEDIEYGL